MVEHDNNQRSNTFDSVLMPESSFSAQWCVPQRTLLVVIEAVQRPSTLKYQTLEAFESITFGDARSSCSEQSRICYLGQPCWNVLLSFITHSLSSVLRRHAG